MIGYGEGRWNEVEMIVGWTEERMMWYIYTYSEVDSMVVKREKLRGISSTFSMELECACPATLRQSDG
jgi:hypothetical protein